MDCEFLVCFWVDYIVGYSNFFVGVCDDGEVYFYILCFFNIVELFYVVFNWIYVQGDYFGIMFGKFFFECCSMAQFGCINWCKVCGVRIEYILVIFELFVKINFIFGSLCFEVRCFFF